LFEAAQWFEKGENHDSSNPFFSLSHAAILSAEEDRRKRFTEALHRLEESDSLKKREVATRAIGLSWAIVASKAVDDGARLDHYRRMFSGLGTSVRQVAGREQLFFCPTTKQLLTFVQFQAAIDDLK